MSHLLSKQYKNHYGLDLKSSDIDRNDVFASDMLNAQYKKDGSLEKRKGFRSKASSQGGSGLFVYNKLDTTTGSFTQELLTASDKLYKLKENKITIAYTGAESVAVVDFYFNATNQSFYLKLVEGTTTILDYNCGKGFDAGSIVTLANLKTQVDNTGLFTMTITGSTATPAAFMDFIYQKDAKVASVISYANYYEEVTSAITPFTNHYAKRNETYWEIISSAQLNNCIYFSNGYDDLMKYDSTKIYKAGMKQPDAAPTVAVGVAGALTGAYKYMYAYRYTDYYGNVVEGIISAESTVVNPSSQKVDVTYKNIKTSDNTGYDTDASRLKIVIYRTENGGTVFYEVASVANDPANATSIYTDNTSDTSLGAEYVEPIVSHGVPPKGKYIATYYNQLFITGIISEPNIVYWSDIEDVEYFDIARNITQCQSKNGDAITGISQNNEVMAVFEDNAIHILNGEFVDNLFRQYIITHKVGCKAHATICHVESSLYFLADNGVYQMVSGQIPTERSMRIQPQFIQTGNVESAYKWNFKRAVAVNDNLREKYIVSLPTVTTYGSDILTNNNNVILTEDYGHNSDDSDVPFVYLKWRYNSTNPSGGFAYFNDNVWFTENVYSDYSTSRRNLTYRTSIDGTSNDYIDCHMPVEFSYYTNWYSFGEPSVFKKIIRLKLFYVQEIGSDYSLGIVTEKDYEKGLVQNDISLAFSGPGLGYGNNQYGEAPYGDSGRTSAVTKLNGKFKSIRIIFSNSEYLKNIELTAWELEVSAPFDQQLKA